MRHSCEYHSPRRSSLRFCLSTGLARAIAPRIRAPKSLREARKKAEENATYEAYKATLKDTQGVKKTLDPWGNLRAPPAGSNK